MDFSDWEQTGCPPERISLIPDTPKGRNGAPSARSGLLALDGDDDLAFVEPLPEVAQSFSYFAQWVDTVDDRNELASLGQILQISQTLVWSTLR